MIYTTGWTQKDVDTEAKYLAWLSSLKDGDTVLQQEFYPADKEGTALGRPYERWLFTVGTVRGERFNTCGDSARIDRASGKFKYWGTDDLDWGNVFPARIVPNHTDMSGANENGDMVFAHHPIYEPNFLGCYRHFLKAHHGASWRKWLSLERPFHYTKEVEKGMLIVLFSSEDQDDLWMPEDVQYLYSEYIPR